MSRSRPCASRSAKVTTIIGPDRRAAQNGDARIVKAGAALHSAAADAGASPLLTNAEPTTASSLAQNWWRLFEDQMVDMESGALAAGSLRRGTDSTTKAAQPYAPERAERTGQLQGGRPWLPTACEGGDRPANVPAYDQLD